MPLMIALWLAFLHALVAAPVVRVPAQLGARATCAEASALAGAGAATSFVDAQTTCGDATLREGARRPAHDALRSARARAGLVATSGAVRAAHVGPSGALGAAPRLPDEASYAVVARARRLDASHAAASRGAVLPYFATAPPLQS